ncbi:MAG: hypothetical protein WDW38_006966 [Sanguina aurantia]
MGHGEQNVMAVDSPTSTPQYDPFLRVSGIKPVHLGQQQQPPPMLSPPQHADPSIRPKSGSKTMTRGSLLLPAYSSDSNTNGTITTPSAAAAAATNVSPTRGLTHSFSAGASRPRSAGQTRLVDYNLPTPPSRLLSTPPPSTTHTTSNVSSVESTSGALAARARTTTSLARPRSASYGQQPVLVSPRLRGNLSLESNTATAVVVVPAERPRLVRPASANPLTRQAGGWSISGGGGGGTGALTGSVLPVRPSSARHSGDSSNPHTNTTATAGSANSTASGVEALLNKLFGNLVISAGTGGRTAGVDLSSAAYNSGSSSGAMTARSRPRSGDPKSPQEGLRSYSWGASSPSSSSSPHFSGGSAAVSGWAALDGPMLTPRGNASSGPVPGSSTVLTSKMSPFTASAPSKAGVPSSSATSSLMIHATKQQRLFLPNSTPGPEHALSASSLGSSGSNNNNNNNTLNTSSAARAGWPSTISASTMNTIVSFHAAVNTASARSSHSQAPLSSLTLL